MSDDNIVNIDFKPQSSLENLLDNIRENMYDEVVFVARKEDDLFVGTTAMEDIAAIIGDLQTTQQYLSLIRLGKW